MADRIDILIAAHKPYWVPDDGIYLPMQVGAACDGGRPDIPGFQRDDEGDNISAQNGRYCELTALFWGWKNLDCEYLGLAHYRRHFKGTGERDVMTGADLEKLLAQAPVVVPSLRHYYIETIESHYGNTFDPAHITALREALAAVSPEHLDTFNRHMQLRSAHIFNMFVMRKDLCDAYCAWLFEVLGEAEKRIDFTGMTPFEERVMGRLSERLFDTWLDANGIAFVECPVVGMEKTSWLKKGSSFLAAKFLGKKYTRSF